MYTEHPGFPWLESEEWIVLATESRSGRGIDSLPQTIRDYISLIEDHTGIPVVSVGVGPDRMASIASTGGPFDVDLSEATF